MTDPCPSEPDPAWPNGIPPKPPTTPYALQPEKDGEEVGPGPIPSTNPIQGDPLGEPDRPGERELVGAR